MNHFRHTSFIQTSMVWTELSTKIKYIATKCRFCLIYSKKIQKFGDSKENDLSVL